METLRAAVIGSTGRGDYGHGLDLVWNDLPGVELVAVADDNKMGLAAKAKQLKLDKAYPDYRRMLDEVKPDLVSIGCRWLDQHRDMVVEAAQRGTHIYLEKPLCRTLAEADEMAYALDKTHSKLVIAHTTRHSPKTARVKEMVADGKLGRILELRGRGKEDKRGGGEDLWVLGTHVMDLMRIFGGDPIWCSAQVTAGGRPITREDVVEGNEGIGPLAGDAVAAMYSMPENVTAYFGSQRSAAKRTRFGLTIYGTEGVLEMTTGYLPSVRFLPESSWSAGRTGAKWLNVSSNGLNEEETLSRDEDPNGNRPCILELLSAIRENRTPSGGIDDARKATEMIVAVFESQRIGGRAQLPLENRQNPLTML
ncbi:MAG: gfo/Idh/MocA family oxidoreductase [Planctomycetota bacterium]|nr:MAG: gfo/Idh/MocA family oxidoreductase [Planctomycetota bacterium]